MESGWVDVQLFDDRAQTTTNESVTSDLASLFGYAHRWAAAQERSDVCDLTFSSMLAAMMASDKPLCSWLRGHLALRGVQSSTMTGGLLFTQNDLYPTKNGTPQTRLVTTRSFRTALEKAKEIRAQDSTLLDVRHYMAAYAVCPQYHLHDFLRLRIDRRAWCLQLAHELALLYPGERSSWEAYATMASHVPLLAFNTDAPEGSDLLNLEREVEAFSRLIAARSTHTPLSIGVFGAWGSGKSFFMRRVRERVARYADFGRSHGRDSPYHGKIAQIEFNAWHYSEGKLIACLVDHIFRNLQIGVEDDDEAILRGRGADLLARLDHAKQGLVDRERQLADAEERRRAAERAIDLIDGKLPHEVAEKRRVLEMASEAYASTQRALSRARQIQDAEINASASRALGMAALGVIGEGVINSNLASAVEAIRALAGEARTARLRWRPILLGLLALGLGAIASAFSRTELMAQLAAAAGGLVAVTTMALSWLGKLNDLAARGQKLQDEEQRIAERSAKDIAAAHAPTIAALEATIVIRGAEQKAARAQLELVEKDHVEVLAELDGATLARAAAVEQRNQAAAEVAAHTAEFERLSSATLLGEFLTDRVATDGYRAQLTIFSQVRNDFERLSRLMTRATDAYYVRGKPEPTVSRIVLYIDDLDRCPEEKVIEVLRTVHLLLAFPLFACVVAVDPRWVTRCLRNAPGLMVDATLLDDEFGVPATPTDYLEKIFQIPLWLRPVPESNVPAVVRCLLDPARAGRGASIDVPVAEPPALDGAGDARASGSGRVRHAAELTIAAAELDYLESIGPLLGGNPRALKRFVNTYRLVKTALSDVELEVFHSGVKDGRDAVQYHPYRVCMAQLAVLCTQRHRGLELVRHADGSNAATVGAWLKEFEGAPEGQQLAASLRKILESDDTKLPRLDDLEFSTFTHWLERTRRYSFYL